MKALTREFLENRGKCCFNGCRNCPYDRDLLKTIFAKIAADKKVVITSIDINTLRHIREVYDVRESKVYREGKMAYVVYTIHERVTEKTHSKRLER